VLGRREPSGGTVDVTLGTTIGYFSQFSELDGEQSTYETLSAHFTAVHETQARLDEIGMQLAEPMTDAAMTALLVEQGELFERMDPVGGWTYENTIDTVLTSLGFDEERRHLPVDRLSGGWRNRGALTSDGRPTAREAAAATRTTGAGCSRIGSGLGCDRRRA
jgi:ATPase subunit of ABC transporter with duplicated ATPase domains